MKLSRFVLPFLLLIVIGCASTPWYGNESSGFNLLYRFPEAEKLVYTAEFSQNVSMIRGSQTMDIGCDAAGTIALTCLMNKSDENNQIETVLNGFTASVRSPRGAQDVDLSKVMNKPFRLIMNPKGEIDTFDGHLGLDIPLDINGPGRSNVRQFFKYYLGDFFPRLPDMPQKQGGVWTTQTIHEENLGGIFVRTTTDYQNRFSGFEEFNGSRCLKIDMTFEAVLEGNGDEGSTTIEGDFEGKATYLWDVEKGLLMRYDYEVFGEASMARSGGGVINYSLDNGMKIKLQAQ